MRCKYTISSKLWKKGKKSWKRRYRTPSYRLYGWVLRVLHSDILNHSAWKCISSTMHCEGGIWQRWMFWYICINIILMRGIVYKFRHAQCIYKCQKKAVDMFKHRKGKYRVHLLKLIFRCGTGHKMLCLMYAVHCTLSMWPNISYRGLMICKCR